MTLTKFITGLLWFFGTLATTRSEAQAIPDNAISYGYFRIDTIPTKSDTAKVIMLVCDTLVKNTSVHFNDGKNYIEYSPAGFTFWVYGFAVTHYKKYYWRTLEYLGSDKKPISKHLIVWDYKTLPQ